MLTLLPQPLDRCHGVPINKCKIKKLPTSRAGVGLGSGASLILWEAFDLFWWDHTSQRNMVGALLGREVLGGSSESFPAALFLL